MSAQDINKRHVEIIYGMEKVQSTLDNFFRIHAKDNFKNLGSYVFQCIENDTNIYINIFGPLISFTQTTYNVKGPFFTMDCTFFDENLLIDCCRIDHYLEDADDNFICKIFGNI